MLIAFFIFSSFITLIVALWVQQVRAGRHHEQEAVILFESKVDPPFLRPIFTALTDKRFHFQAPVVHAKLASGVLMLELRSDAGGEQVGLDLAITNVELAWLKGDGYRYLTPDAQLLVGPQAEASERLLRRTARLHNIALPESTGRFVHAYDIKSLICDPAEDSLHFEVNLPDGGLLKVSFDYARMSVAASVDAQTLYNGGIAQALAVKIAA